MGQSECDGGSMCSMFMCVRLSEWLLYRLQLGQAYDRHRYRFVGYGHRER